MLRNCRRSTREESCLRSFSTLWGISQYRLAKEIRVPPRRINEIIHGARSITADTALRLAKYLGTSAAFWLNLQTHHDLEVQKDRLGKRLEREIPRFATAAR